MILNWHVGLLCEPKFHFMRFNIQWKQNRDSVSPVSWFLSYTFTKVSLKHLKRNSHKSIFYIFLHRPEPNSGLFSCGLVQWILLNWFHIWSSYFGKIPGQRKPRVLPNSCPGYWQSWTAGGDVFPGWWRILPAFILFVPHHWQPWNGDNIMNICRD